MTAAALPAGTRFLSREELARRRAARARRRAGALTATEAARRAEAAVRSAKSTAAGVKIPVPARPHASDLTPLGFTKYARESTTKVPAALLLFAVIVAIRVMRRSTPGNINMPSAEESAGLLIAALLVAILASFVPDLVAVFLLATLVAVALDATPAIQRATAWLTDVLNGRSTRATAGVRPVTFASPLAVRRG